MIKCKVCGAMVPPQSITEHSQRAHPERCGVCQESVLPSESIYNHTKATHPQIIMG